MAFHQNCYFLSCVFIFLSFTACFSYKSHIVEESCKHGRLVIPVTTVGKDSSGILKTTRHISYHLRMKCNIQLIVPPNYGVVISIRMINLRVTLTGLCIDYLKIFFGDGTNTVSLCQTHHDLDEAQSYATTNSSFHLLYQTANDLDNKTMARRSGFQLTFTSFQQTASFNHSFDDPDYFECDNGRYIWSGLKCDGHNNCGDRSDEGATGRIDCGDSSASSMPFIIAGTLMVMLLFIACMATLVCRRKNRSISLRKRLGSRVPIS